MCSCAMNYLSELIHANVMLVLFIQDLCIDKLNIYVHMSDLKDGLRYPPKKSNPMYFFLVFHVSDCYTAGLLV